MRFFLLCIVFSITSVHLPAQNKASFSAIDQYAAGIPFNPPKTLALQLTRPYSKDIEKTRSIFRWITDHISYDIAAYHNDTVYRSLWRPAPGMDQKHADSQYDSLIVSHVLATRTAVCEGYARLFRSLATLAGLRCEIIVGYTRDVQDGIGVVTNKRHAWNTVMIDGNWQLMDVTWASGSCDSKVTTFTRQFDEFYFCTPPIPFFNNHFPDDSRWSLLKNTPSRGQFYGFPFFFPAFHKAGVIRLGYTAGVIDVRRSNPTVFIEFDTWKRVTSVYAYEFPIRSDNTGTEPSVTLVKEPVNGQTRTLYRVSMPYRVTSDSATQVLVTVNGELFIAYGLRFR